MSVSQKGRRSITVGEQQYIWYVAPDADSPYDMLQIISDDKSLILSCPLHTAAGYVISKGRIFQAKETNGLWNRYLLPFAVPEAITPKFVEAVIVWATQNTDAVPVTRDGNDVPV